MTVQNSVAASASGALPGATDPRAPPRIKKKRSTHAVWWDLILGGARGARGFQGGSDAFDKLRIMQASGNGPAPVAAAKFWTVNLSKPQYYFSLCSFAPAVPAPVFAVPGVANPHGSGVRGWTKIATPMKILNRRTFSVVGQPKMAVVDLDMLQFNFSPGRANRQGECPIISVLILLLSARACVAVLASPAMRYPASPYELRGPCR